MTYNVFSAPTPAPTAEPYTTLKELGVPYPSNRENPSADMRNVLIALEDGGAYYYRDYLPLPNGTSDPGDGPYMAHRAKFSGKPLREDELGPHFEITWVFNKYGHMLTCEVVDIP
jgi:hypothetical protein